MFKMDKRKKIVDALEGVKIVSVKKDYGSNSDYIGVAIRLIYKNKKVLVKYDLFNQDLISMEVGEYPDLDLFNDDWLESFIDDWVEEHIEFECKVTYDNKEVDSII